MSMATAVSLLRDQLLPRGGRAEVVAACLVVAVIISMILPVPVWLLDMLIAVNICVSCLLVVLVMQIKEPVHLSTFPSLLLMTTLFRVSINVASTRQILLEGSAGHIIEAFGEVVVGGNLVVGLVVFTILTLIQFLVITKGSERVAEVGARFTLDAMPGKQLAIDIELKAGTITPEEARSRRTRLGQESQFFGAMDGALKFVKGDSIAGIVITLTNLIGGLTIGVTQRGMAAAEAAHLYSVLSIGDALVAQIPSLLMSLTAGLLITRVANGEAGPSDVGKEIATQVTAYPKAWITASVAMLVFGWVPGMPTTIFIGLSGGALLVGWHGIRQLQNGDSPTADAEHTVSELREFSPVTPFLLRFGPTAQDLDRCLKLLNLARTVRNQLVTRYGMVLPAIESQFGVGSLSEDVEFCHNEVRVFVLELPDRLCVAECPSSLTSSLPVTPRKVHPHPRHVARVQAWFAIDDWQQLVGQGLQPVSDWDHAAERFERALLKLGPSHVGIEQAQRLCRWMAENHEDLGKELERSLPLSRLADVIQRLLVEQVSIRNIVRIAEALIEWGQRERDPGVLCECVRSVLGREICSVYAQQQTLHVLMLDSTLEELIRGAVRQTSYGDYLALQASEVDDLCDRMTDALEHCGTAPCPVLLTAQDIRAQVRRLFQERFDEVPVIAINEVPPDFKVRVITVLGQEDALLEGGPSARPPDGMAAKQLGEPT